MSKRDFELIAGTIQHLTVSSVDRAVIAAEFATALRATNAQFNRDRFLRACVPDANVRART